MNEQVPSKDQLRTALAEWDKWKPNGPGVNDGNVTFAHVLTMRGKAMEHLIDAARAAVSAAHEPPVGCEQCSNVAPIAKIMVADGFVSWGRLYAPGLPNGQHDLYPSASTPPPDHDLIRRIDEWFAAYMHDRHDHDEAAWILARVRELRATSTKEVTR